MPADLRAFLETLDRSGLLVRIDREVDPETEAARLMVELDRRGVAGLFTNVRGADASLVYNLLGTRAAFALALGVEPARVRERFRDALANRIAPQLIDGDVPAQ